jgi:hypothetical protein
MLLVACDSTVVGRCVHLLQGVFNVFLGAMLGGSIISKIRIILVAPSSTPDILGAALTSSSNFFINFVIIQVKNYTTFST